MDSVEGWLSPITAQGMLELAWLQEQEGRPVSGLAEIGIHHGKSFIALACAAQPGERLFAIDVFEDQHLNLDGSGAGNREIFLAHLARHCPAVQPVIVAASSDAIWPDLDRLGLSGVRLFSIDGGHTRALTLNDLKLADKLLADWGVCALDDVLNAHWTGVLSGLFDFLSPDGRLVPFALLPNKLMLCRPDYVGRYAARLRQELDFAIDKADCEFGDWKIDVYGERPGALVRRLRDLRLESETAPQPADAEALRARVAALQVEVAALRQSSSWRVTAPLRAMAELARRVAGR